MNYSKQGSKFSTWLQSSSYCFIFTSTCPLLTAGVPSRSLSCGEKSCWFPKVPLRFSSLFRYSDSASRILHCWQSGHHAFVASSEPNQLWRHWSPWQQLRSSSSQAWYGFDAAWNLEIYPRSGNHEQCWKEKPVRLVHVVLVMKFSTVCMLCIC